MTQFCINAAIKRLMLLLVIANLESCAALNPAGTEITRIKKLLDEPRFRSMSEVLEALELPQKDPASVLTYSKIPKYDKFKGYAAKWDSGSSQYAVQSVVVTYEPYDPNFEKLGYSETSTAIGLTFGDQTCFTPKEFADKLHGKLDIIRNIIAEPFGTVVTTMPIIRTSSNLIYYTTRQGAENCIQMIDFTFYLHQQYFDISPVWIAPAH